MSRASKAALNIINKGFMLDMAADNVDCFCIHPGYVRTDLSGRSVGNRHVLQ